MATPHEGTRYSVLADGVIEKMRGSGFPGIAEGDLHDMILAHLRASIVRFKAAKVDLSKRDDLLGCFNIDLSAEEIEILTCFLLIEYLSANYINVPLLLRQKLTSRDFNVFSSRNHLDGLVNLRDTYIKEVRQMISIYSNQGSDLFTILKNKQGSGITPEPIEPHE